MLRELHERAADAEGKRAKAKQKKHVAKGAHRLNGAANGANGNGTAASGAGLDDGQLWRAESFIATLKALLADDATAAAAAAAPAPPTAVAAVAGGSGGAAAGDAPFYWTENMDMALAQQVRACVFDWETAGACTTKSP